MFEYGRFRTFMLTGGFGGEKYYHNCLYFSFILFLLLSCKMYCIWFSYLQKDLKQIIIILENHVKGFNISGVNEFLPCYYCTKPINYALYLYLSYQNTVFIQNILHLDFLVEMFACMQMLGCKSKCSPNISLAFLCVQGRVKFLKPYISFCFRRKTLCVCLMSQKNTTSNPFDHTQVRAFRFQVMFSNHSGWGPKFVLRVY